MERLQPLWHGGPKSARKPSRDVLHYVPHLGKPRTIPEGASLPDLGRTVMHYRDGGAFQLHAFVLMPDHFHALLTPSQRTTLERAVQYVKGGSAHRIRKELNFRLPVWQRGYSDHRIRDGRDYELHLRYLERNPVTGRLAAVAADYVWSSASGRFPLDDPPSVFGIVRE